MGDALKIGAESVDGGIVACLDQLVDAIQKPTGSAIDAARQPAGIDFKRIRQRNQIVARWSLFPMPISADQLRSDP